MLYKLRLISTLLLRKNNCECYKYEYYSDPKERLWVWKYADGDGNKIYLPWKRGK